MPKQIKVPLRGQALLNNATYNKGTAFTEKEREEFGLRGRLPFTVCALDQQIERAYAQYKDRSDDIHKNSFLNSLKIQNEVLFYSLVRKHLKEMFPIIYTPTEAEAISSYSHLFRRPEGLYLSPPSVDFMEEDFLQAIDGRELDLIVVSDGEQILGIGDQGSGAIGISSAKAVIYSLVAGIDPARCLPVALDVGTNNEGLREDDLYVGWKHGRVRGQEYDDFVDKFVQLVRKHCPKTLLHFEDFGVGNAQKLLGKYRDTHAVFNDDIQGTGAITLATLQAAVSVTKSKLSDQRIIQFGAGSAGLGIARQIRDAMVVEENTAHAEASSKFWLVDKYGLIKKSLGDKIRSEIEEEFIRTEDWEGEETGLLEVVKRVKPTVLIGTSTQGGAFTEEIVREMAKHVDRPIIFPLSNPTKLHECTPKDAMKWTGGKALMSTGSPFDPVDIGSGKDYVVAECNNALLYPGLGLGVVLSDAKRVTDKMIIASTTALAALSPALKDPTDSLLPPFEDALEVSIKIALAVIDQAIEEGQARAADIPKQKEEREAWVRGKSWKPEYGEYVYVGGGEAKQEGK